MKKDDYMFQKLIERIYILFWDIKRKREMNIPSKKKIKKNWPKCIYINKRHIIPYKYYIVEGQFSKNILFCVKFLYPKY